MSDERPPLRELEIKRRDGQLAVRLPTPWSNEFRFSRKTWRMIALRILLASLRRR